MIEHNGGEGETGTPLYDKENGVPQTISNPNSLQPGPGGAIVLSEMPGRSTHRSRGEAAFGQAGLAHGKAEAAPALVPGVVGFVNRG